MTSRHCAQADAGLFPRAAAIVTQLRDQSVMYVQLAINIKLNGRAMTAVTCTDTISSYHCSVVNCGYCCVVMD